MDVSQFRLKNFERLYREFREEHSHLPLRGMLTLFGERVDISPRYLGHIKNGVRPVGAATARQIEKRLGKPHGWMDLPHDDENPRNADLQLMMAQITSLYDHSPEVVKRLIADAIREVLTPTAKATNAKADAEPRKRRA